MLEVVIGLFKLWNKVNQKRGCLIAAQNTLSTVHDQPQMSHDPLFGISNVEINNSHI